VRRRCQRINSVPNSQGPLELCVLQQTKKNINYQRIQKSEEERALAQEFKRVYWRESKRKYCSQLSEQEREAAVNVSTPFQIAKAHLSSAYYCNQKRTLITKKFRKVKKNERLPRSLRECIGGNPKESIVLNLVSKREKPLSTYQLHSK
jgi:hypothetical protein